jgi:hypothetical protein
MILPATIHAGNTANFCPECAGPVDELGRCWRCCDRPCVDCCRPTGTAFVEVCLPCEYRRRIEGRTTA